MSTVLTVPRSTMVPEKLWLLLVTAPPSVKAGRVNPVPAEGVPWIVPPVQVTPSMNPPLISPVVTDPRSVHVAPAAVGLPVMVGEVSDLLESVWDAARSATVSLATTGRICCCVEDGPTVEEIMGAVALEKVI
tara:strand:- start:83 stop:481 length:399 start_codon:yes stop_codon:yes gene_type:complete